MGSEDKQDERSVWRWIPTIPISAVYGGAKYAVTAGSQGTLDLTKYCGKQVWWISSKCGQTAMSALSPGVTVVESAYSLGKQALSISGQYGRTALSTLSPGSQYVKIPVYVVYESGKAFLVEGYKSGMVNAKYYGKLGYNSKIAGNIGACLGPIVGFSLEPVVLASIPASVDWPVSLMTPSVKAMIGPALATGIITELGDPLKQARINRMQLRKITQGTKVDDVWMMRAAVYAYIGKGCGHIICGGLGAAGGFVFGGIAGGVVAIPEGFRKGLEKACNDAFCNSEPKPLKAKL